MNPTIKNYLGGALAFSVLIISYAAVNFVNTYGRSIEPSSFRSFSVIGEGKVISKPDVATFTYGVITEGGTNLAELQQQHIAQSTKVNNFVKNSGVNADDIKTENYSVEPKYQYYNCALMNVPAVRIKPCPPPQIVGYTVRETVSVKIRDFNKVGNVLGGVVQNGANDVSQLSFTIDDPTKIEDGARAEAIAKAKAKAEAIANAGGFNLGRLLSISEGRAPGPFYGKPILGTGAVMPETVPAPVIEPGSEEISVNVTLTYEIR